MSNAELFEQLDGRRYVLHGISGVLRYNTIASIYPSPRLHHQLVHEPDAAGMRSAAYRAQREQMGDDWITELTHSPEAIAAAAYHFGLE